MTEVHDRRVPFLLTIVVPTIGRDVQLGKFLKSLLEQKTDTQFSFNQIELLVVDQNQDDRVSQQIEALKPFPFFVQHSKINQKGTSNAKNTALANARGIYVCFLDDDCWLETNALSRFFENIQNERGKYGFILSARTPDNRPFIPGSLGDDFILSQNNKTDAFVAPQIAQVFPTALCKSLGGFNVRLGVGSEFGSAEETDLLVRCIENGCKFIYLSKIAVYHDYVDSSTMSEEKGFSYGMGFGAFCKIHGWNFYWFMKILRSLIAAIIHYPSRRSVSKFYWAVFKGRWRGYWTWSQTFKP